MIRARFPFSSLRRRTGRRSLASSTRAPENVVIDAVHEVRDLGRCAGAARSTRRRTPTRLGVELGSPFSTAMLPACGAVVVQLLEGRIPSRAGHADRHRPLLVRQRSRPNDPEPLVKSRARSPPSACISPGPSGPELELCVWRGHLLVADTRDSVLLDLRRERFLTNSRERSRQYRPADGSLDPARLARCVARTSISSGRSRTPSRHFAHEFLVPVTLDGEQVAERLEHSPEIAGLAADAKI